MSQVAEAEQALLQGFRRGASMTAFEVVEATRGRFDLITAYEALSRLEQTGAIIRTQPSGDYRCTRKWVLAEASTK